MKKLKEKINELAKYYSPKVGLDLQYFLRVGFWYNIAVFFEILFSFLFSIILVRNLDPFMLGRWYWLVSIVGLFGIFSLTGFNTVAPKSFIAGYYSSYNRIIKIKLISSALGSLLLLTGSIYMYLHHPSLFPFFILMAIFLVFSNLRIYDSYLYAKDKFGAQAIIRIIIWMSYYLIAGILLLLKVDLIYVFTAFFGLQAISSLVLTIYFGIYIKKKEKTSKKDPDLKLGYSFSFLELISQVSQSIDKIILPVFFNFEKLAIYGIALIVPNTILKQIKRIISNLVFKKSQKISERQLKDQIIHKMPYIVVSYLIFSVFMYYLTKVFIIYILNTPYTQAIIYSEVLILTGFFAILAEILRNQILAHGNIKKYSKFMIIPQVIQLILFLVLIPLMSIWGAVIAISTKNLAMLVVAWSQKA